MKKYFKKYSNCILTKGIQRSVICDLQKQTFHIIPNTLYCILYKRKYNRKKVIDLYKKFKDNRHVLEDYFSFLIKNDLIILSDTKKELRRFPKLQEKHSVPHIILNAIMDIREKKYSYEKVINQLELLVCKDLMIRFFSEVSVNFLNKVIDTINSSDIANIEIVIAYSQEVNESNINEIVKRSSKISKIYVHSTKVELKENILTSGNTKIIFTKQEINNSSCCGYISPKYFMSNYEMYLQGVSYNNCLYKKIGIDENGEIKNCPAMKKSFGNINNTSLIKVVDRKEFKKLWYLKKDDIEVCKVCEFRYLCSDCRTFLKKPDNILSQPQKCNYNPYIAKWAGEEGYVPIENVGCYDNKGKFIIDKSKIDVLNGVQA